ncbi:MULTISPECIES: ABC transporter substrate-binding protein [Tessaracoccus]|uniref:ABC transporter substrate-binding protein n=1 Tax=Tessaracoccus TaxID=72763 RepID=UPI000AB77E4E|nr:MULTISPECIES: ABC transporter substrate-binding protein [Tessaracoccus]VEP41660.1 hypothetical protein TLA_TLA_02783 [Tessaracoccus lapidicaptus]
MCTFVQVDAVAAEGGGGHGDHCDADQHQQAAAARGPRRTDYFGRPSVDDVGQPRPARDHDDEDPLQPSADGIVGGAEEDGLAEGSVAAEQGFGLVFMMFNMGLAPMNEVKNRQGVMYALDYDRMTKVGMADLATPATSFLQKEHPSYQEASTVYTLDVEKAKALFAETGLTSVRLLASNHDFFAAVRPIIKESLEAAGLTVNYEEKQSADVYGTIDSDPNAFDIVVAPGDPSVFGDDADLLLRWWYSGDVWTDTRMHWKGQESHTQMQELLDQAVAATGDEQQALWGQAFDLVSETLPLYPLFHRKTPTAFDAETLVDFKPIAVTGLSFVDVGTTQ